MRAKVDSPETDGPSSTASESSGTAVLRDLSGEELQALKTWAVRCRTEFPQADADVGKMIEGMPKVSFPEPANVHLSAFSRVFVDALAAWLDEFGPTGKSPRQDP